MEFTSERAVNGSISWMGAMGKVECACRKLGTGHGDAL